MLLQKPFVFVCVDSALVASSGDRIVPYQHLGRVRVRVRVKSWC